MHAMMLYIGVYKRSWFDLGMGECMHAARLIETSVEGSREGRGMHGGNVGFTGIKYDMSALVSVCMSMCMCACVYVYMYVCMSVCMYL
jgi:hypothetical protein